MIKFMAKIKDRIALGIISSLISTVPATALDLMANKKGLSDYYYNQVSTLFLPRSQSNSLEGKLVSVLVNNITSCMNGVATTYLLSATGRDNALVKGVGVYGMSWLTLNGLMYQEVLDTKTKISHSPLVSFLIHVVAGAVCGFSASKLGDDSLFPDIETTSKNQKLPLVGRDNCNNKNTDLNNIKNN